MVRTVQRTSSKPHSSKGFIWLIAGSFAIVALALVALPLFNTENAVSPTETPVGVIAQYPQQFTGNDVKVQGEITDRMGHRGFTVRGKGILKEEILVISKNPLEAVGGSGDNYELFNDNKPIQIQGTVKTFNLKEIEDEIGFDLPDKDFAAWEGKRVIVADTVANSE